MDFSIYAPALPEVILALGAMALLMLGAFTRNGVMAGRVCGWLALGVLALALVVVLGQGTGRVTLFEGAYVADGTTASVGTLSR